MGNEQNSWSQVPKELRQRLRDLVFHRDGGRCMIKLPGCTGKAEQVDHVVPRSHGGALTDLDNLQAACTHCNSRKPLSNTGEIDTVGSVAWFRHNPSAAVDRHHIGDRWCRCGTGRYYPSQHWGC